MNLSMHAQGDTLESVAKELRSIVESGRYTFHLDEMGMNRDYMLLEYEPASTEFAESSSCPVTPQLRVKNLQQNGAESKIVSTEPPMGLLQPEQKEKWNLEQIGDFVRKLGFLDEHKEKEGGIKIKDFVLLNQV